MKELWLYSIIIPVYNSEKSLIRCVDSIIKQKYSFWEMILVDDGSWDQSVNICDNYAQRDRRIKVIHQSNKGVSEARNAGLGFSNGKYILFIDSDDYVEEDFLEEYTRCLSQYGPETFVWCGSEHVLETSKECCYRLQYGNEEEVCCTRKDALALYVHQMLNVPWNKCYLKELIEKNNIKMPKEMSLGEDLIFNLRYMDALGEKRIVINNRLLYHYMVQNTGNLNSKYYPDKYELVKFLNRKVCQYSESWNVLNGWKDFYNFYFWDLNAALKERYYHEKGKGFWKCLLENGRLMRDEQYQFCLNNRGDKAMWLKNFAYQQGLYGVVLLCDKLSIWKKKIVGEKECLM